MKNEQLIADLIADQKGEDHTWNSVRNPDGHTVGSAQVQDGKTLTKFANNTYQYAYPGQTEVLDMQSIQIVEELEKMNWPLPSKINSETLKHELMIADQIAAKSKQ